MWEFLKRIMGYPDRQPDPVAPYKIEAPSTPPLEVAESPTTLKVGKPKAPPVPVITARAPRKPREPKQ